MGVGGKGGKGSVLHRSIAWWSSSKFPRRTARTTWPGAGHSGAVAFSRTTRRRFSAAGGGGLGFLEGGGGGVIVTGSDGGLGQGA